MVIRIVKLTFQKNRISEFLTFFETIKEQVISFENCKGMKLLQDVHDECTVMTYSYWKDEESLNVYRDSELFGKVWPNIKPWFASKPEAWTLNTYFDGFELNSTK